MVIQFKDREKELEELSDIINSKSFEFLVLYGRRRVGKTELILKASENKKRIYYLAVGEKNLERFYELCSKEFPELSKFKMEWDIIFDFLKDKVDAIIIDEFQNMIKESPEILNILQSIIDLSLKNTKVKLFLVGSSVSIITSKVLSYKSPLYGRRTGSIDLKPVSFLDLPKFFPFSSIKDLVEMYSFADGIPLYLIKIDKAFWHWLREEINLKRSFLKDELDFLLKYEFSDSSTYKLVLEAISNGKTTVNEIKDFSNLKRTDISPYLSNLIEVGLVKKEIPLTESIKSRKGHYQLSDNFLKFWFRYIYPNLSLIESGNFDTKNIENNYPEYVGHIFEDIIVEFFNKKKIKIIEFSKIGRWWDKDKEIDLIVLNEKTKEILLGECKWKDNINAEEIIKNLAGKSSYLHWNDGKRKEHFAIFAKSFKKKINEFEGKKVYCFDLDDLGKLMK